MESRAALAIKLTQVNSGTEGVWLAPKNKVAERVFIRRILPYSARKKRAKGPPAYSTLNPETSSDSPSVKSNGARLVSASVEVYHIAARGQAGKTSQILSCVILKVWSVKLPEKIIMLRRIRAKLTSYEIVWATARRAPMSAYLEFEAQPDPKMEYTAKLERARMNKTPRFRSKRAKGRGIGAQRVNAKVSASIGVRRNNTGDEVEGRIGSLIKSLTPSAIG